MRARTLPLIALALTSGLARAQNDKPAQPAAPAKDAAPAPTAPTALTAPTAPAAPAAPAPPGPGAAFVEAEAKVLAEGYSFVEGPCWVPVAGDPRGGFFVFCDMGGDAVYKWDGEGKPEVFRKPAGKPLGAAVDHRGRLYFAESQGRRITRVTLTDGKPGEPETLADKFEGKRLNDTNDLCAGPDGAVYFTDPNYFTPKDALELDFKGVFRVTSNGHVTLITKAIRQPNGIALSLDTKALFVNQFSDAKIMKIDLKPDGGFGEPAVFADLASLAKDAGIPGRGAADGLRLDAKGNLYSTGPGGLLVVSPEGQLVANLAVPRVSNLAFGGKDGTTVLITSGTSVRTIHAKTPGAAWRK